MTSDCGSIWFDKPKYDEAETKYYLWLQKKQYGIDIQDTPVASYSAVSSYRPTQVAAAAAASSSSSSSTTTTTTTAAATSTTTASQQGKISVSKPVGSLSGQIAAARQQIKESLASNEMATTQQVEELKKTVDYLVDALKKVELRMSSLENTCGTNSTGKPAATKAAAAPAAPAAAPAANDDDEDIDLFGSDDDAEADVVRQERLKAYAEKKSKKPALVAKSSVVLDVKPWDDETDMKALETAVRSVAIDGLLWGVSKLLPVGYGINKLQIVCIVEDEKVSIEELAEKLAEFEDYVQSVDIAAFNKI